MVQLSVPLVDHVLPRAPVCQWVLSLPKRLRCFLHREAEPAGRMLRLFLHAVEPVLRKASPGVPPEARSRPPERGSCGGRGGGVTFVQRFGASLNPHFHCGAEMRIISFITCRDSIERILSHIGEPTEPPPIAPAHAPPGFPTDVDPGFGWEISAEPIPEIDFDQRHGW